MSGHSRICNHTVESSFRSHNEVNSFCYTIFTCYICVKVCEFIGVTFLHSSEVITRVADVEGVNFGGGVGQADFCEAKADTLVCTSYYKDTILVFICRREVVEAHS